MILQALYNYYEAMRKAHRIATPGLEVKPIRWVIVIREDGSFVRLKDLKDPDDKKSKVQDYLVPAGLKRSGKYPPAQPFWDNRKYILGYEEGRECITPSEDRLESFKWLMFKISEQYPGNASFKAVCRFYESYRGLETPLPEDVHTERILSGDWITFQLQGDTELLATQEDAYDFASHKYQVEGNLGRCLITGERGPLAEIHARIIAPGSKAGATIASFNDSAYLSYGKKQGENAPISKCASFAHTTALNELLRNEQTHYKLGDIIYVFWNSDINQAEINEAFSFITFRGVKRDSDEESNLEDDRPKRRDRSKKKTPDPTQETYKVLEQFKAIRGNRGQGQHWDDKRQFYILGFTAGGRISIKYWQQGSVSEIFDRVYQHLVDMDIIRWDGNVDEENPPLRSLYGIVKSVSTPSKSNPLATNLVQSIVESILDGTPYPMTLQQACINRIIQERKVSELRAAILKGCINRKARLYNNLITLPMALDKQNNNIAYLAGRIFAVLEQIQQASLGRGVNATIRDRFYVSASTRPNMVMGRLIALSNHHLSKLRKEKPGLAVNFEKLLEEIFALIPTEVPAFPATLSLDEQSLFAVGYYHQKVDTYKKEDIDSSIEESEQ